MVRDNCTTQHTTCLGEKKIATKNCHDNDRATAAERRKHCHCYEREHTAEASNICNSAEFAQWLDTKQPSEATSDEGRAA